ncbi:MAG: hotdog fold thioesterase [Chloroflexota bacterium]
MSNQLDAQKLAEAVGDELSRADQRLMTLLGMELMSMAPGKAVAQMVVRKDMTNSHGYCQGGLIFTLADHTFAYACMSGNQAGVTLSANVIYANPAKLGDTLIATATVTNDGGRTATCDVVVEKVEANARTLVAQYQGVNYRVRAAVVPSLAG